jgi:hypothetical protein
VVTLYVVPLLYRWLAPRTSSPQTISRRLAVLVGRGARAAVAEPVPAE